MLKDLKFEMRRAERRLQSQIDHDAPAADIADTKAQINYYRDAILHICRSEY
jgi:hypothetical protein